GLVLLCLLVVLFASGKSGAQSPLPHEPVVSGAPGNEEPISSPPPNEPPSFPGKPFHAPDGPFFTSEPALETPGALPPGPFATLETTIVGAHVNNRLINTVLLEGTFPNTIQLPSTELEATVSPRFELGYRLPAGYGEFLVSYRFLIASGTDHILTGLGLGQLRSELNLNVVDLDYASREICLSPSNSMRWHVGTRLAGVYFNSNLAVFVLPDNAGGGLATERVSNNFLGAGPHLALDLIHKFRSPGAYVFGRVDAAAVWGSVHQSFGETFTFADFGGQSLGAAVDASKTQVSPMLGIQFGLAWTPPAWKCVTFSVGYEFEEWWDVGRAEGSQANVTFQGIFFGTELVF
ncbi:MAG TPA: Lpg1974 family pore-forming outer membrane protein, partial [Gemmataceae bacterium]|nr:Lpg1974 family pore-forming outer membrane protein [Gemmataceae bacterium]